jgi:quinol monooxygenase YgiN
VYAVLRKAKLADPGAAGEAARRVRESLVPLLRSALGFRLHLGLVSEACEAVGASLFADHATGRAALRQARTWAASAMADLTAGEPVVRAGEVSHHRVPAPGPGGAGEDGGSLFVVVREYRGVGRSEEAVALLRERVLPVVGREPGFRGFWAFRDEADPDTAASVSLWANRGSALSAHGRVLETVAALRDVFPAPPEVTAGAARVVAAADDEAIPPAGAGAEE